MRKYVLILLLMICPVVANAYNYLFIHPTTGEPIKWDNTQTIKYWLDPGPLGRFTNDQAKTLLQEAMKIWENTSPDANVPHFEFAGYLPEDVDGTNYQKYVSLFPCYTSDLSSCASDAQKNLQTVIIFDNDSSILNNELCRITQCSAASGAKVFAGSAANPGNIVQGISVFSGNITSPGTDAVSAYFTMGIMVHELGHLLGLAHTVVNQEVQIKSEWSSLSADVPTMMSVLFPDQTTQGGKDQLLLNPDDIAGISVLYPSDTFQADTATIKGQILKSDGTPMMHVNVIARNIDDPLCEGYSWLSGRICPPPLGTGNECFDSNGNVVEVGNFSISGLPAGTYTIEVEEVADRNLALTLAPGLIPGIDALYGDAEFWNEGDQASEDHLLSSTITLAAGETKDNVDIVLDNNTVTPDRIQYIPLSTFTPGPGTRCPSQPSIDYAAMIGIDETPTTSPSTSRSSGGCSLVR